MVNLTSEERREVAKQVHTARLVEENNNYSINRSSSDYYMCLGGIDATLGYIKNLLHKTVLDIGAGTTKAISEFEARFRRENPDLNFVATALRYHPDFDRYLGRDKVKLTPVEILRGFKPESVSFILAVFSITYCQFPSIAIDRINEVLEPGGVIKARFGNFTYISGLTMKSPKVFADRLRRLDYDVALNEEDKVLLAVKPPFEKGTAVRLLKEDKKF